MPARAQRLHEGRLVDGFGPGLARLDPAGVDVLEEGGTFVAKVLAGGTDQDLLALLKKHFRSVKHAKPPASRKGSSEWYVIAQGFKGDAA